MKIKYYKIILGIFFVIIFLVPTLTLINPLITNNYLLLEQNYLEPKSSAGVDLTIIVTDQQMPGVINVTDDFLASPSGSGVSSVTVMSSGTTSDTQFTTISTALASGSTQYDIVGMDVVWTGLFAVNGWIIPLDSYISSGALDPMSYFVPGMVQAGTYNGHVYAYPYFMNLGILWYRKDLMDQYGFTPADFATWEGLNATANYILNNETGMLTNPDLVGYVGQFDNYEGGTCNFFEIAGSNGATDLISGTNVNIYPNQKLEDAMTFFQSLFPPQYTGVQGTPYIIPRNGLVMDEGSSITTWIENNTIFMRQWTFAYPASIDHGIDFGIAPLPHFSGATNYKTSCVGGALLAIPTVITGAQRAAAINFTKYLGESHAQQRELTNVANFPALKSVYANPPTGFDWIKNWTSQLDQTLSRPVEAKYPLISSVISNDFNNILSKQKSVTQGLNDMQTSIEQLLHASPDAFMLSSDANDPDPNGKFNLTWTYSIGADNYSIYTYNNYITNINQSLTLLANQDAISPHSISGLSNGTYYYIIVADNEYGSTLSNCIKIVVEIPKKYVPPQGIPGYDIFYLVVILGLMYAYLIFKRFRNTTR